MTCVRLERGVALWVGGELSARRAARIAAHVAGCERCRVLADRLLTDRRLVAEAANAPPPLETLFALREGVLIRLSGEAVAPRPPVRPLVVQVRWASALAVAMLFLAAAGVLIMRSSAHAPGVVTAGAPRPAPSPSPTVSLAARVAGAGLASPSGPAPGTAAVSAHDAVRAREGARPASRTFAQLRRSAKREATAEALVIKLLTDDPDVVIYWLVDQQKG
jgi:hypothetical protein